MVLSGLHIEECAGRVGVFVWLQMRPIRPVCPVNNGQYKLVINKAHMECIAEEGTACPYSSNGTQEQSE